MSQSHHRSLWPTSLEVSPGFDFGAFLEEQAEDLKRLLDDAFNVAVERRIVESVIIYNFVIVLRTQDYRYQLFSIRTLRGDFPARIVAPHLPEPFQVFPVANRDELVSRLTEVFHHPSTMKVIATLKSEGFGALGEDEDLTC